MTKPLGCPKTTDSEIWTFLRPLFTEEEQLKIRKLKEGEGCKNTKCRHNILWNDLKLPQEAKETEASLSFQNCMRLVDEKSTLEVIGDIWKLTRERVRQVERDAMIKLLRPGLRKDTFIKEFLEDAGIKEDSIQKRLESLKAKKDYDKKKRDEP